MDALHGLNPHPDPLPYTARERGDFSSPPSFGVSRVRRDAASLAEAAKDQGEGPSVGLSLDRPLSASSLSTVLFAPTHSQRHEADGCKTEGSGLRNRFEAVVLRRAGLAGIGLVDIRDIALAADRERGDHVVRVGQAGNHVGLQASGRIVDFEAVDRKTSRPDATL